MVKRTFLALTAAAVVAAAIAAYVVLYLTKESVVASAATAHSKASTQLYLATVPAAAADDPHPTWVSYYRTNSQDTNWKHETTYVLPANSLVHVTIFQYDSDSGLRNPFISQAQGIVGGNFTLNGKTMDAIRPEQASHVFAVPNMGVSVPLAGVETDKNTCGQAPCNLKEAHETVSFTFRTGAAGIYRWQCFVPCGAGTIFDFGDPMQTVGYMDGFLKVV